MKIAATPNKPAERVADRRALSRAAGTIPSCDHALLAFAIHLAAKYGWNMQRVFEFLARPGAYQREWELWLKVMREGVPRG